jgi:hypothetical protein
MSTVSNKIIQAASGSNGVEGDLELIGQKWGKSTVTVTRGVDYEDGDLLFNFMFHYSNTTIAPESGWTLINSGLYSSFQSFAFSRRIAGASSYTTNNGNFDNVIVVFRPTGYDTFTEVAEDEGLNSGTASITMTDTNDSLYLGFGAVVAGDVVTTTKPSFATEVDVTDSSGDIKFYWAYQGAGHGNTGTQTLDVSGTFEICTAIQLDLT